MRGPAPHDRPPVTAARPDRTPPDYPTGEGGFPLRLRDGRRVRLRPVEAADADALIELHHRLSFRSRYYRYFSPKPRLSRREAEYLAAVDGRERLGAVATAEDEQGETVVALASLVVINADRAELGLVVRDDYQGLGLGSGLGEALAAAAARRGIRFLTGIILTENRPMLRLAASRGGRRVSGCGAEVVYELDVGAEPGVQQLAPKADGPLRAASPHGQ